jgi:hypothetical protein
MELTMAMKSKFCILCGAAPTTSAHLFASAIRDQFPDDRAQVYRMGEPIDPSRYRRVSHRVGSGVVHVQPKVLCEPCNSAWMNVIEQSAAPLVARIIRGEEVSITSQEQAAIAEWAVAVAILRAELVPGNHSFDPAAARAFRLEGLRGADIGVWLARVDRTQQGVSSPSATSHVRGELFGVFGSAVLLWLKEVCVIVAQEPYRTVFDRGLRGVAKAVRGIPSTSLLTWPLRNSLTDRTLLDMLELDSQLTPTFLEISDVKRGRLTEQVLRVRSDMPADDLAVDVMARRLAEAEKGPWLD